MTRVALVHDYLTQRGGAERVVLAIATALHEPPIYTSFYDPAATFPEFEYRDVRSHKLNHLPALRRHHRAALPVLAKVFAGLYVDADVTVCSSSGWAHGVQTSGRKVVYCHTPARWLYQSERYVQRSRALTHTALYALRPSLRSWDRRAAASADRYLVNSNVVRLRVRDLYGIEADVVHPPAGLDPSGPYDPDPRIDPEFFLCVSRFLPYKNVDAVVAAFAGLPALRLVVVGSGPQSARLLAGATKNVIFAGEVSDSRLRWLYRSCAGVVAASYEDFGLTPVEAASFAKPAAVLRWGGFLDTVLEGETGVFFDQPTAPEIAHAISELTRIAWDRRTITAHAHIFSTEHFAAAIRNIVEDATPRTTVRAKGPGAAVGGEYL